MIIEWKPILILILYAITCFFPQKFTNEDHLAVHMRKHEMSLALNMGTGLTPGTGKSPISALMPGLFLGKYYFISHQTMKFMFII